MRSMSAAQAAKAPGRSGQVGSSSGRSALPHHAERDNLLSQRQVLTQVSAAHLDHAQPKRPVVICSGVEHTPFSSNFLV